MTAVTREQILAITGELGDAAIAEIEKLGATEAELLEAVEWLSDDERMQREAKHPPQGRVAMLYEILVAEDEADDAEARRRS
jgi:hypothetical protein